MVFFLCEWYLHSAKVACTPLRSFDYSCSNPLLYYLIKNFTFIFFGFSFWTSVLRLLHVEHVCDVAGLHLASKTANVIRLRPSVFFVQIITDLIKIFFCVQGRYLATYLFKIDSWNQNMNMLWTILRNMQNSIHVIVSGLNQQKHAFHKHRVFLGFLRVSGHLLMTTQSHQTYSDT